MIISRICGGLGNQLFQYAAGVAISKKYNHQHKIDTLAFQQHYSLHDYSLQHFNITTLKASDDEIKQAFSMHERKKAGTILVNANDLTRRDNIRLSGYWIGERYFAAVKNDIRNEFTLTQPLTPFSRDWASLIENTNAVSIHVRGKDFKQIDNVKNICTRQYYSEAIRTLAAVVDSPTFYVFTDDEFLATQMLSSHGCKFVIGNNRIRNYEDLHLMGLCKHNIIANSTFSWWGAWLNTNPDKIIIYPNKWGQKKGPTINEIIPPEWQQRLGEINVKFD